MMLQYCISRESYKLYITAASGVKPPAADEGRTPASAAGRLTTSSWIPGSLELDVSLPLPPLRV